MSKRKMNPRKKYANGSSAKGMDTNNYIVSPAEALNDYNIMLAKVEQEAASNPWLPIVGIAGQAMQTGIDIAGKAAMAKASGGGKFKVGGGFDEVNKNIDVDAVNKLDFSSDDASLNRGVLAAMGMNDVQQDVEVEGGEMYETPQGQVGEFKGPSHEEGGIPLEVGEDVQEGTKVYSDRLKVGKKTLAERKATRERQIANLEKIASQPLVDQAVKNAVKRKMMSIEREEAADLDFQEKVNNLQTMADTMVAAFGTGMAGIQDNPIGDSMRYGYGSGSKGVRKMFVGGTIGEPELDEFGNPIIKPIVDLESMMVSPGVSNLGTPKPAKFKLTGNPLADFAANPREYMKATITPDTYFKDTNNVKTFQDWMDTNNPNWLSTGKSLDKGTGYGNYGPNTQKAAKDNFEAFKTSLLPAETPTPAAVSTDYGAKDFLATFNTGDTPDANASTTEVKLDKPGTAVGRFLGKAGEAVGKVGVPNVGDMTKLIGNYLGMTSGIKTAAEQRSTDVTHRNVFAKAGEESQRLLDNAKQGIETSKAQAIVKATDVGRGGKRGGRNSARGVNQMRAMDWLYDSALQQQIADISAKAAEQMTNIDVQKSGVAMSADQLRGEGQFKANMANEAAKDAYYTALGQGRKDFATGMQQSGKDLNDMKTNKILENLLGQDGEYVGMTSKGNFFGKPTKVKGSKTSSSNVEIPDGKGGKITLTQEEYKKLMAELTKSK